MTTGPATKTIAPAARLGSRIIAAMRTTLTSTRRSDEISLVMNAKSRAFAIAELGRDAHALRAPQTTRSPASDVAQLAADAPAVGDDDDRVHALALDLDPSAVDAHVRSACWSSSRSRPAPQPSRSATRSERVLLVDGVAAERHQLLDEAAQRRLGRRRDLQHRAARSSSLVRPISNCRTSNGAAALDDGIEDRRSGCCESIRWPSAWTTTA